jgi:hypothetical protein
MSEYIEIETEISDDNSELYVYTNLSLSENEEIYHSVEEMEEGSPIAQALAGCDGIAVLEIDGRDMTIQRTDDATWHAIVTDLSAMLKDFFL